MSINVTLHINKHEKAKIVARMDASDREPAKLAAEVSALKAHIWNVANQGDRTAGIVMIVKNVAKETERPKNVCEVIFITTK
jgi:hypothetical protein